MRNIAENIISKYQFNVKSFDRIEDFGIEKRSLYAHSTFGKFLLKVKVSVSLVLLPKSGKFFKKNIFEGCRYPDIIDLFNPEDCSIIEGWHAFPTVIKKRQGFIWGGGIIAAFEIAMHLGDYTFLNRIIDRLNLWNIDQKEMFLYLYEDTQPLGIVLSSVFFNSKNIHTICIAHGYFPDTDSKLKYEGNNSNYNFVWSLSQAKFFNKDVNVTLLGLPYEYSMAKILNKNRIILLGHSGEGTNMFEYLLTYFHMFFVYNLLKREGYQVIFKPHPQDDKAYAARIFKNNTCPDLHQEIRKGSIFLGFISSALYEAKAHGLYTIGMDTGLMPYKRSFKVDKAFKFSEYKNIPKYIKSLPMERGRKTEPDRLKERFYRALSVIN